MKDADHKGDLQAGECRHHKWGVELGPGFTYLPGPILEGPSK